MLNAQPNTRRFSRDQWIALVFSVTWLEVLAETYRLARKLWQDLADEGMYEDLEHESTQELLHRHGKLASFQSVRRDAIYSTTSLLIGAEVGMMARVCWAIDDRPACLWINLFNWYTVPTSSSSESDA